MNSRYSDFYVHEIVGLKLWLQLFLIYMAY